MASKKLMNEKTAIITGVTGQDGSYLAENLLNNGYKVIGMKRRASSPNDSRLQHILHNKNMVIEEGDVTDISNITFFLLKYEPSHFFNLAAQSHVATSFNQPKLTWDVTAQGCMNCLEAIRMVNPLIRFYQASSSEMYGDSYSSEWKYASGIDIKYKYQAEHTSFNPQSPYAIAKLAAYNAVRLYRKSYGMFASNGILFNHESPRRGEMFVTQKIAKYVAELGHNKNEWIGSYCMNESEWRKDLQYWDKLKLGNLDAYRDWGHAEDYVEAMRLILEDEIPDDFVVGTGETHSVRDFAQEAFSLIGEDYSSHIVIDDTLKRPAEVPYLRAMTEKVEKVLGWTPKRKFRDLVKEMVEYNQNKL